MFINKALAGIFSLALLSLPMALAGCQANSGQMTDPQSNNKPATFSNGHWETDSNNYHIILDVTNPPLKATEETYLLRIQQGRSRSPVLDTPEIKVFMPMGKARMEAPTTFTRLGSPGYYRVQTQFMMAGNWMLEVKPTSTSKAITLTLPVQ